MKFLGRFVVVFFAYGMALLHTAVPHQHAQKGGGQTIITRGGCLFDQSAGGVLQRALSTDLGYGHLETFKKGGDCEFDTGCIDLFATLIAFPSFISELSEKFSPYADGYVSQLKQRLILLSTAQFRAPPDIF